MKTRICIPLALSVVGLLALLWFSCPIAPDGQKLGSRTNTVPKTIQPFAERRAKQRRQSQDTKMAEQELLGFGLPLDTEAQRQEFYDKLMEQPPQKLFQAWKDTLGSDKERHKGLLEAALADSLKKFADNLEVKAVYPEAARFLDDRNESESSQIRMVKWVGHSGTPEALLLLLEKLNTATGELRFELLGQLATVGNSRWDRSDSEKLSALLEAKWKETVSSERPDARLLGPLAQALAKVGYPEGIKILLDEVASPGGNRDARVVAAFASFKEVRNDVSVPVLAAALSNQAPDSPVLIAAGEGLVAIGNETATIPLIVWAQAAGDEYAEVAEHLFSKLWHPVATKKAHYVFVENNPFASEKVRTAVQSALAQLP